MPQRPCLVCGTLSPAGRCPDHRRRHTYAEDQRRAGTVAAWVAEHGWVCPGWQRPPHESTDLTADHIVSFAVRGDESSELAVLCRPCNSSKGATA